ncbi:SDR family NAD(P)-dependent oxidoreductase [Haematobacter missouriensis]|uniref:Enoyl-ACP reductase n=1 Tax=Haematobacter missouriensis TaxID=366616 RepID=A0A212AMS0_9RHOB|nr:SDR family oxidoreductase [Haematobacter missouriensis]OWJ71113.1 enoyl-ACP reductase [Haematobacter missouriensis]OWJ82814.1 enoyl-ACP reductase [Haematobacter missouriensis]
MKRAIVTGGAGLIGTGICEALASAGWDVVSLDLRDGAGAAQHVICDVTDEDSVTAAFDMLGWDEIDLLVNNAGIAKPYGGPLAEMSLAEWRRVVDSHLTGAFLVTRAAIPRFRAGGSIVNMASTRAVMSEPETEPYATAKGGLIALTHALAVSLGPRIRVNAIAPGWIADGTGLGPRDHAQHPAGRVGTPADVAEAVLYLASAGFMTGQVLVLDGGMTRKMIYED